MVTRSSCVRWAFFVAQMARGGRVEHPSCGLEPQAQTIYQPRIVKLLAAHFGNAPNSQPWKGRDLTSNLMGHKVNFCIPLKQLAKEMKQADNLGPMLLSPAVLQKTMSTKRQKKYHFYYFSREIIEIYKRPTYMQTKCSKAKCALAMSELFSPFSEQDVPSKISIAFTFS